MLLRNPCKTKQHVGAIIVSPTRELASQIFDVVEIFARHVGNNTATLLLTGGTSPQADMDKIKSHGCNIIVATPGRLWDLFRSALCSAISYFGTVLLICYSGVG